MNPQCKCGRFLANACPIVTYVGEGYGASACITDVVGTCSRCGPDSPAILGPFHSWDAWKWPEGWE